MFSRIFIERPRLAVVVSLVLSIAGVLCIGRLPVAEYPEIAPPQITVSASYTGAGSRVVMETVAIPLEAEINVVEGLQYFSSTSSDDGAYSCSITFKSGTNADMAMVNVQNAVKRAEAKLPSEVTRSGITVNKRTPDILQMLTFSTDGSSMSLIELSNYVGTTVKDALSRIDGVAGVSVTGAKDYAMRIWLDPMRLAGLGVSTEDVAQAIETQNVQAAAGFVGAEAANGFLQFKVNTEGRLTSADQFGDVVVRSDGAGGILRLRDIARVELGAEKYSGNAVFDGNECVALTINRNSDANALETAERVNAALTELSNRFPTGVSYAVSYDPTKFIVISLREIAETLVVALALVILITYAFLQNWRATLIPGLAIPVSLLATFPVMLASFYINDFYFQGNFFKVKMQADNEFRSLAEDIHALQIPSNAGEMVPLSSLATIAYTVGPKQVQRFNKMVSAELSAQTAPGASTSALMAAIEEMALPQGYHIEWTGSSYEEKQNQGQIVMLMALALLFAYLFLVAQYESWTMPVSVMLSVAFAVLGALLGLFVMRMDLSIYAQLGLVMLIGLAAKNAILIVEFSKQERERGVGVEEAAMNGANLRYRAVMMTAWSFLFGVFPLVVATGAGSASRRAIGVTTFSGMVVATLVGIVFVPALYALCQRTREWTKATLGRKAREVEQTVASDTAGTH